MKIFYTIIFLIASINSSCVSRDKDRKEDITVYVHLTKDELQYVEADRNSFFIGPRIRSLSYASLLSKVPYIDYNDNMCFDSTSNPGLEKESYDNVEKCLKRFSRDRKIKYLVVGSKEKYVRMGGYFRTLFQIQGMQSNEAELFVDKYFMKQTLLKNDPTIPTSTQILVTAKHLNFTDNDWMNLLTKTYGDKKHFIMKPTSDAASRGVMEFQGGSTNVYSDIRKYVASIKFNLNTSNFIIEDFVDADVYRMDGYMEDGKIVANFTARSSIPPKQLYQAGTLQKDTLITDENENKKYDEFTLRVLKALNYKKGVYHLEAFVKPDGTISFLEIAARPGGGLQLTLPLLGYDASQAYIYSQLDKEVIIRRNNKIFDVIELYTPLEIADSKQRHRIITVKSNFSSLETYLPKLSYIRKSFTSIDPDLRLFANLVFVTDKKNQAQMAKDVQYVYDTLKVELLVKGGKNYFHKYTLENGTWTHAEWNEASADSELKNPKAFVKDNNNFDTQHPNFETLQNTTNQ